MSLYHVNTDGKSGSSLPTNWQNLSDHQCQAVKKTIQKIVSDSYSGFGANYIYWILVTHGKKHGVWCSEVWSRPQSVHCEAKEGPLLDSARLGLDDNEEAQQEALSPAGMFYLLV